MIHELPPAPQTADELRQLEADLSRLVAEELLEREHEGTERASAQ